MGTNHLYREDALCRVIRLHFPPEPHRETTWKRLVRKMHPEAINSMRQLEAELKLHSFGPRPFENLCAGESHHVFWAFEHSFKKRALGMMCCTPIQTFGHRFGVIHDAIVLSQHQQRGIATELLETIIAWTREEAYAKGVTPITALQTSVARELTSATQFFMRRGFRRITEDDCPYYERDIRPGEYCPDNA
jgi:GNAT superfamily N-acetyltransferase